MDNKTQMDDWTEADNADWFKFEQPGDEIFGRLVRIGYQDGQYGQKLVLTLRTDDGKFALSCPTMLQRAVEEEGPSVGRSVGAKVFEARPSKKGNNVKVIGFKILDENGIERESGPIPVAAAPGEPPKPEQFDDDIPF